MVSVLVSAFAEIEQRRRRHTGTPPAMFRHFPVQKFMGAARGRPVGCAVPPSLISSFTLRVVGLRCVLRQGFALADALRAPGSLSTRPRRPALMRTRCVSVLRSPLPCTPQAACRGPRGCTACRGLAPAPSLRERRAWTRRKKWGRRALTPLGAGARHFFQKS